MATAQHRTGLTAGTPVAVRGVLEITWSARGGTANIAVDVGADGGWEFPASPGRARDPTRFPLVLNPAPGPDPHRRSRQPPYDLGSIGMPGCGCCSAAEEIAGPALAPGLLPRFDGSDHGAADRVCAELQRGA